jgi:hypothetical protein
MPSAQQVCTAHSHGARVVVLSSQVPDCNNATARQELVNKLLSQAVAHGTDGINLDIERKPRICCPIPFFSWATGPVLQLMPITVLP